MAHLTVGEVLVWLDAVQRAMGGDVPLWLVQTPVGRAGLAPLEVMVFLESAAGKAPCVVLGPEAGGGPAALKPGALVVPDDDDWSVYELITAGEGPCPYCGDIDCEASCMGARRAQGPGGGT